MDIWVVVFFGVFKESAGVLGIDFIVGFLLGIIYSGKFQFVIIFDVGVVVGECQQMVLVGYFV